MTTISNKAFTNARTRKRLFLFSLITSLVSFDAIITCGYATPEHRDESYVSLKIRALNMGIDVFLKEYQDYSPSKLSTALIPYSDHYLEEDAFDDILKALLSPENFQNCQKVWDKVYKSSIEFYRFRPFYERKLQRELVKALLALSQQQKNNLDSEVDIVEQHIMKIKTRSPLFYKRPKRVQSLL